MVSSKSHYYTEGYDRRGRGRDDEPNPNAHSAVTESLERLADISIPSHPSYGQHIRKHEVDDMLRSSDETNPKVTKRLESVGILPKGVMHQGQSVQSDAIVAQVEFLLSPAFQEYPGDGVTVI